MSCNLRKNNVCVISEVGRAMFSSDDWLAHGPWPGPVNLHKKAKIPIGMNFLSTAEHRHFSMATVVSVSISVCVCVCSD